MKQGEQLTICVSVTNVGEREGSEVVQLYIKDLKSALPRPVKELKGFQKVSLQSGETKKVTFVVNDDALSYFDDQQHEWVVEPGKFEAVVAASATDLKTKVAFEVK